MHSRAIVSKADWIEARRALLTKEKEFTRARDRLADERCALPWLKIEKPYVFDGPAGKVTLSDLFDGRSQIFIKHFMMGPGATTQCVGCSFEVDHVEGILTHLNNHDVTYAVVARAPIEEIEIVRKRMGWKFPWVSSYGSDFNYDFGVSFRSEDVGEGRALYNFARAPDWAAGLEDLSGDSVFFKDGSGQIYLTYPKAATRTALIIHWAIGSDHTTDTAKVAWWNRTAGITPLAVRAAFTSEVKRFARDRIHAR